jgi:hypothetical protein
MVSPSQPSAPTGMELADVGVDPAQRQARHDGKDHQAGDEDHLRQDQPERHLLDAPVLVLQLAQEDGVDQPEQVQEADGAGDEDQDHRQPGVGGHDGVVEDPAPAVARQRRHTGHGDDADEHRDEGQRHQRQQPAHLIHLAGAGALGDAADGQEQHRLVDEVVDDEHQRHQPAQVVHHRQAEQRIAHLADGGVGQQALGVLLEHGHQVADQRRQGADPQQHIGQLDIHELLPAHGHQQQEEPEQARP